jgi:type II secretory pathway component PulJ
MAELESVMQRLDAHTRRLQERSSAQDGGADEEKALMVQGLALVSEALVRVGRDIRFLRLRLAEKA